MSTFLKDSLWASFVVAMALACTVALSPAKALGMGGDPFHGKVENLQKLLDLSERQVEQLQALHSENRGLMRKARREMVDARRQFRSSVQDAVDESAIREAFQPVATAMTNMEVLKGKMKREYKMILTAEQFDKFQALRKITSRKDLKHGRWRAFQTGGRPGHGDGLPWPGERKRPEIE